MAPPNDELSDLDKTMELSKSVVRSLRDVAGIPGHPTLLIIRGNNVGRSFKLSSELMILGRSQAADICLIDEGISRKHAQIRADGMDRVVEDLGSTNGIFINGKKVKKAFLSPGDQIRIGSNTVLKFSLQDELEEQFQQEMYDSAVRDGLTGTFNKRYFRDSLATDFAYHERHAHPLSVIMMDIDFFKKVNDTYGHVAGDYVLKVTAKLIGQSLRTEDILCRYGGEEFGIILRNTDVDQSILVAERIRKRIAGHSFVHEDSAIPVTVSLGIATLVDKSFDSAVALVQAADKYLYAAKQGGRNRTACARRAKRRSQKLRSGG